MKESLKELILVRRKQRTRHFHLKSPDTEVTTTVLRSMRNGMTKIGAFTLPNDNSVHYSTLSWSGSRKNLECLVIEASETRNGITNNLPHAMEEYIYRHSRREAEIGNDDRYRKHPHQ